MPAIDRNGGEKKRENQAQISVLRLNQILISGLFRSISNSLFIE